MNKKITLLTMSMIASAGIASAGRARAADVDNILLRQTIMDLQGGTLSGITAVANAKGDIKKLEGAAKGLQRSGTFIPALFPKGTESGENTKAKAEIWSDPAGFKKASDSFDEAATKLVAAVQTGESANVLTAAKGVEDSCVGCHRTFRAR